MAFKKGDQVTQIMPAPIAGTVAGFSTDQEIGQILVKVDFTDADGVIHSRYFKDSEIQLNPAAPATE